MQSDHYSRMNLQCITPSEENYRGTKIVGLRALVTTQSKMVLYESGLENCALTGIVVLFRRTKMFRRQRAVVITNFECT